MICFSDFQFSLFQYESFSQFGKLRFVGFDRPRISKGEPVIGFMEFEDESDSVAVTEELIAKGRMDFEDKRIQVKSLKEYKRRFRRISANILNVVDTFDTLLQPPAQDSPQNILNVLCDDCLREIFKKLHFSTLDTVANVCIRFNRVAKEAFLSKYRTKTINILELDWNRNPTMSQIEYFLKQFGSSISSISTIKEIFTYPHYRLNVDTNILLKMIGTHCKNLKKLELSGLNVNDRAFYENRELFERLKILKIRDTTSPSIFDIVSMCSQLECLSIDTYFYDMVYKNLKEKITIPKIAMPKLVEADISSSCLRGYCSFSSTFNPALVKFLELNSKLKILKIGGSELALNDSIMNALGGLSELNEFDIQINVDNLNALLQQTLSLHKIQNLKLKLGVFTMDANFCNIISKFRHITALNLNAEYDLNHLILLLQNLPHLKSLDLCPRHLIIFKDCQENQITIIKTIVQHANQLSKLTLASYHSKSGSFRKYPINEINYYDILESVEHRNTCELTIVHTFLAALPSKYTQCSQSLYILNMADLLTIKQQTYG